MAGPASANTELTTGPRFTGADQFEKSGAALGEDAMSATRTMAVKATRKKAME
jgi:hypothetical protein